MEVLCQQMKLNCTAFTFYVCNIFNSMEPLYNCIRLGEKEKKINFRHTKGLMFYRESVKAMRMQDEMKMKSYGWWMSFISFVANHKSEFWKYYFGPHFYNKMRRGPNEQTIGMLRSFNLSENLKISYVVDLVYLFI